MEKRRVDQGDIIRVTLPYSEVCMHMKVAGQSRLVELLSDNAAQIYADDGVKTFSFPVLPGEAGLYRDDLGWYVYVY